MTAHDTAHLLAHIADLKACIADSNVHVGHHDAEPPEPTSKSPRDPDGDAHESSSERQYWGGAA